MKPVYKIETYTGATKDYTITEDAPLVCFKDILTDAVGYFHFTLNTVKGIPDPYYYGDIALNDKVKIWVGYDSYTDNPQFVGRITKIDASPSGYTRVISGLSLGEILLRRLKKNKIYNNTEASAIVVEWASDLGLGVEQIQTDPLSGNINLEVQTKSYFDLLRDTSDYWLSAGSQIKKDFHVAYCATHANGDLVWKTRPLRTAGVDTLTIGDNINNYTVNRNIGVVRNDIVVYGATENSAPSDKDAWTETLTNWSATAGKGTLSLETDPDYIKAGTYSIKCTHGDEGTLKFKLTKNIKSELNLLNSLYFWIIATTNPSTQKIKLFAPDESNRYEITGLGLEATGWLFKEYNLGSKYAKDTITNPNAIWDKVGSPNWWNIQHIEFELAWPGYPVTCWIDSLYFYPERWEGSASDYTTYRSELEVTDDNLHSDADCVKRAETLLYQKKTTPIQLEVLVKPGSNNILIGDRIPMTIPAEGISTANFDVLSVEQQVSKQTGFTTKATMINTADIRQAVATDQLKIVQAISDLDRALRSNYTGIKVSS